MVDLTTIGEQSKGLSMFTIIAGAGGAVGYAIAGEPLSDHNVEMYAMLPLMELWLCLETKPPITAVIHALCWQ